MGSTSQILCRLSLSGIILLICCHQSNNSFILPDVKPTFHQELLQRDSTLLLDSFYLVGIDTMTMKSSLYRQRFPFIHLLFRLQHEIDSAQLPDIHPLPKAKATKDDQMKTLQEEQKYVRSELDSLDRLYADADSITPVGYRAIYKVTVRKKDRFVISDTVAYALSLSMELSDWDRNIEKGLDSLAVGRHVLRGPFNLRAGITR